MSSGSITDEVLCDRCGELVDLVEIEEGTSTCTGCDVELMRKKVNEARIVAKVKQARETSREEIKMLKNVQSLDKDGKLDAETPLDLSVFMFIIIRLTCQFHLKWVAQLLCLF